MNLLHQQANEFRSRHIGPNEKDTTDMLKVIGEKSLEDLVNKTVPSNIRMEQALDIHRP